MKYSNHQTKYIGKQAGLRTYQHPGTLSNFRLYNKPATNNLTKKYHIFLPSFNILPKFQAFNPGISTLTSLLSSRSVPIPTVFVAIHDLFFILFAYLRYAIERAQLNTIKFRQYFSPMSRRNLDVILFVLKEVYHVQAKNWLIFDTE